AATLASMLAAFGAAVAIHPLHAAVPLHNIWRVWAAADALGIIIVAPLLVGLYHLAAEPMPKAEAFEGTTALAVLAAASSAIYTAPLGSPLFHVPPAALFPFLLWITARCRPVFAAAAALILSVALVGATTFRVGPFAGTVVAVPTVQV